MFPEMHDRESLTTPTAIDDFEAARNLRLPAGYREFLLATNGGTPVKSVFPLQDRPHDPFDNVQDFLGIGVSVPTSELAYAYDLYFGGFPFGIVPIANQDFGSYICLDLRDGKERVVFWDHRHFWSTGEWREQDLYHVADSFGEFLGLLRPSDS